ncbi:ABC transporter ATP-binding protein [Pollutimonas sp. M17]|uniref:ABC transporter ATP-binding protein n=1 Tax=Pollutimonas sp. M17 TaxID=2962065 RepID=UPI0021F41245|nr:ABC transporter ATP-binding protein [Pollutimonas sp. M17]UYO93984.1 ABC transporter ATP-binding protein/permease [Pollutimonas sp. M17]
MRIDQSLAKSLIRLWSHIAPPHRRQLVLLLALMMIAAISEIVSIGAIFPFLAVLTAPERVFEHAYIQPFLRWFELTRPNQLLLPLTVGFCATIIIAGCMRMLLVWVQTRISYTIGADLALDVYRKTLHQPYAVHVSRNSSEIINGVYSKASSISSYMILPVVTIASTAMLLAAILITLLAVDPLTSSMALGGFALIYGLVIKLSHRRLLENSQLVADEAGRVIKSLQEGLGGIRDVLIDRTQEVYCRVFRKADLSMRNAQINSAFIAQSPRFVVEALGMLLIATLAYNLTSDSGGISSAIPILGALALGAQRLLPISQQAYQAWATIRSNQASLLDTLSLLDQPLPDNGNDAHLMPLPFERDIQLRNVSFRYTPDTDWVLRNVNLRIPKGCRVGFVGATGCGKSTMLDVIMGLLSPTTGQLVVDDTPIDASNMERWQKHIAHVPQTIFLADSSIESNIAFGVSPDKIDRERVRQAAQESNILETIESWSDKFNTGVGERGVRLSGGQRQRIGIARALYKQADVLVLDEATSALDNETERAVMNSIRSLGPHMTVLIIAHRLNTLKGCDLIVKLGPGQNIQSGARKDLLSDI